MVGSLRRENSGLEAGVGRGRDKWTASRHSGRAGEAGSKRWRASARRRQVNSEVNCPTPVGNDGRPVGGEQHGGPSPGISGSFGGDGHAHAHAKQDLGTTLLYARIPKLLAAIPVAPPLHYVGLPSWRSNHSAQGSRHNSRLSSLGAPSAIAPHPFGQLDTPARLALVRPSPQDEYLTGFDAPIAAILGSPRSTATPKQPWRSTLRPSSAPNSRCARHPSSSPASQPASQLAPPQLELTHNTGWLQDRQRLGMPLCHPFPLQIGTDLPRSRSLAALPGSTTSSSSTGNVAPSKRNTRRSLVLLQRSTTRRRPAKSAA
jgi:hypothetical protein